MILQQYGWHGVYPLRCMLEEQLRERQYQEYTADMQSALVVLMNKMLGADIEVPSILDVWRKATPKTDERGAEEIKNDLMARLSKVE